MRRKTLTDRQIAALKPRPARYALPDPVITGLYIRVSPNGVKTYTTVARMPSGKQVWTALGDAAVMSIDEARENARDAIKRVRAGLTAIEMPPDSVENVVAEWRKRYAEPNGLRSLPEMKRMLDSHILPEWRDRVFVEIKRSDVTKLMDKIEDKHGARAADYTLTTFSAVANWHANRVDDYTPPIRKGMRRQKISEQARSRILDDVELRAIWAACKHVGTFGDVVKFALLTGQRRARLTQMQWSELDGNVWKMPLEDREKMNGGDLTLPPMAMDIINARPRIAENPYVFFGRGSKDKSPKPGEDARMIAGPFKGLGQAKLILDKHVAKELPDMPGWVVHDLRRTARSLMSRAGVSSEIAERVLGHAISGVEGTYDRHTYLNEKADALAKLAALVQSIIDPPAANVVPMKKTRTQ